MRDVLGPGTILGYCTNVHAGADFAQTLANLRRYLPAVKAKVSPAAPLGAGLWFSAPAAGEAVQQAQSVSSDFTDLLCWLTRNGIIPFTLNGFPQGDFHEPVVKHRVYKPDWREPARTAYTRNLLSLLFLLRATEFPVRDGLLPAFEGSLSTLPIAWEAGPGWDAPCLEAAVVELLSLTEFLALLDQTGHLLHLDLEPEPGCILQRAGDVVRFFEDHLLPTARRQGVAEDVVRRHMRVCHDICHGEVMFEDWRETFRKYQAAGIQVGKVQISSAVRVRFDQMNRAQRAAALEQLRAFHEPRYLHQTVIRDHQGRTRFYEDLPLALAAIPPEQYPDEEWRVHFHVPVFLERFGLIDTTQEQIVPCVREAARMGCRHFEVETYAWGVLPEELRRIDLAEGIANELLWVTQHAGVA